LRTTTDSNDPLVAKGTLMTIIPEPEANKNVVAQEQTDLDGKDSISQREQASKYVEGIDNEFMNEFRALLKHYIELLSTDISEISEGLNLSRPVVTDFINGKRNDLPLSIGSICHLHKTLTETRKVQVKRRNNRKTGDLETNAQTQSIKKIRDRAQAEREKLKNNGPDELLMTAGFQPRKMKMVPVSPQQYSQLSFISFLYKDRPISQDLFFQITEQEIDRKELIREKNTPIKQDKGVNNTEEVDIPIEELYENSWMNSKTKNEIQRKYDNAINTINKEKLTSHEKAGLLTSVLHNQLNKNEEINFKLRVIRVERIPLSLTWDVKRNKEFDILWKKIKELSNECEHQLGGMHKNNNQNSYPIHQLTRTIVTCRYVKDEDEDEVNFEYISTGTHAITAISAIFLNMGIDHSMPTIKLDIKCFAEDIISLTKVLVILKYNDIPGESVLGEWVSSDLLQAMLQATVVASKKWLRQKIGSDPDLTREYQIIVGKIAELRSKFYKYRIAFDGYDFNDGIVSVDKFVEIDNDAKKCIKQIENIKSNYSDDASLKIWNNFISNFYRISIGSQLYRLIHENIKFNHDRCKFLLEKIDNELLEIGKMEADISKVLIPSRISLEAEKIAYNLSFGISPLYSELQQESLGRTIDLLTEDNILDCLEKMDEKINDYLKQYVEKNKCYNDPGYDIHYSLGSYYSITGRLLLYRGANSNDINSACDRLLKAIYYFHRIGLSRKVERNLTLAGRVKVRSKKQSYVQQCKKLSQIILTQNISKVNAPSNNNFELSMKSRLNSLEGEYSLIIEENNQTSLEYCLQALRGSLWLGLNRHIADNLYTISRCARSLENREIKVDLEQDFLGLWIVDKLNDKMYAEFIHTPEENKIAKEIVSMLFNIREAADRSMCWSDVWNVFREASANIWTTWYRIATGDKKGEHPFAIDIRAGVFLEAIESSHDPE
jgi:hypothetical protein